MAHAYNASYSGGRDQEDQGSKLAQANSLQDPIWEIPRWQLEGGSRKRASYSEIWRDAGETSCRQNHQEEAKH
jgi:hypothetical protein